MTTAYWLVKSEPYKYPFAQLQKEGWTVWDGVRSFEARNNLRAMLQAIEIHRSGELRGVSLAEHLPALAALAGRKRLAALLTALRQRYPGKVA